MTTCSQGALFWIFALLLSVSTSTFAMTWIPGDVTLGISRAAAKVRMCDHAALVFDGVGWFDVAVALFTGHHAVLAARFVPYSKRFAAMAPEEITLMLQERLKPVRHSKKRP